MRLRLSPMTWVSIFLVLATSFPAGHALAQEKTVTLEMFLDIESASSPQISPDGQADRLYPGWRGQGQRPAVFRDLDHGRRREPEAVPGGRVLPGLVS